jgi:hypothetical protein
VWSACARRQALFLEHKANIQIGLYQYYDVNRKSGWGSTDTYVHLYSDSLLSARFNNALGYYLQQKGFQVFDWYEWKNDSTILVLRNSLFHIKQRQHKVQVEGAPDGFEAHAIVQSISVKTEFALENPKGKRERSDITYKNSVEEELEEGKEFETYRSLLGMLNKSGDDKCRYLGSPIPLQEEVLLVLVEENAQRVAEKVYQKIKRNFDIQQLK